MTHNKTEIVSVKPAHKVAA